MSDCSENGFGDLDGGETKREFEFGGEEFRITMIGLKPWFGGPGIRKDPRPGPKFGPLGRARLSCTFFNAYSTSGTSF